MATITALFVAAFGRRNVAFQDASKKPSKAYETKATQNTPSLKNAKNLGLLLLDNTLQNRNLDGKISDYTNGFTTFMNL